MTVEAISKKSTKIYKGFLFHQTLTNFNTFIYFIRFIKIITKYYPFKISFKSNLYINIKFEFLFLNLFFL